MKRKINNREFGFAAERNGERERWRCAGEWKKGHRKRHRVKDLSRLMHSTGINFFVLKSISVLFRQIVGFHLSRPPCSPPPGARWIYNSQVTTHWIYVEKIYGKTDMFCIFSFLFLLLALVRSFSRSPVCLSVSLSRSQYDCIVCRRRFLVCIIHPLESSHQQMGKKSKDPHTKLEASSKENEHACTKLLQQLVKCADYMFFYKTIPQQQQQPTQKKNRTDCTKGIVN